MQEIRKEGIVLCRGGLIGAELVEPCLSFLCRQAGLRGASLICVG